MARTSSFVYRSQLAQNDEHYVVTVTVNDSDHMETHIDCKFDAKIGMDLIRQDVTHPFYDSALWDDFIQFKRSGIAVTMFKNQLSTIMVNYLLMEDNELVKFTDRRITPQQYKCQIILSISQLYTFY